MDALAVPTGTPPRPSWVVWAGLAVVLAAAAILSFDGLRGLALTVSIAPSLAWLLPIAVDAGAAVSCATWLGGRTATDAARYAGRMTMALLAVTVLGNAGHLGMQAEHITPPWWVAVLVGAIPPAVVGTTVHLVVLLIRAAGPVVVPMAIEVVPTSVYRLWGEDDDLLYVGVGTDPELRIREHCKTKAWWAEVVRATVLDYPDRESALTVERNAIVDERPRYNLVNGSIPKRGPRPGWTAAGPIGDERTVELPVVTRRTFQTVIERTASGPDQTTGSDWSDADLIPVVRQWIAQQDSPPSQRQLRSHFGIGAERAKRLLELAA